MYKSSAISKIDPNKISKTAREKDLSISNLSNSKNLFDNYRVSDDGLSELETKFTLKEIKNRATIAVSDFIRTHLKSTPSFEYEEINISTNIHKFFENLFFILRRVVETHYKESIDEKEVLFTVRAKESAKIRLVRDEQKKKTKTGKQMQELQKVNEDTKKELYQLKEEKNLLEKRHLGLIQEFKNRKNFYTAEIKKLTDIISMSPFDIRKLVLTKTKEAKVLEERQDREKNEKVSLLNFQGQISNEQINILQPKKYQTGHTYSHRKQDSRTYFSELNTEPRPLKNITSIQHIDQQRDY